MGMHQLATTSTVKSGWFIWLCRTTGHGAVVPRQDHGAAVAGSATSAPVGWSRATSSALLRRHAWGGKVQMTRRV